MSYTPQTWTDNDPTTPLSGARLTHMETGIAGADAAATAAAAAAAAEATARSSAIAAEAAARDTAITTAVNALLNGAPGALDTLKELADAINDDASFAASVTTALAGKAPISTTTIDLVDRTNNTTETVPAGTTTNCATAGVTKTAPALAGTVGTPPLRFAVKNISTGSITVAYPDQAGTAQSLTMLTGETRTFRQKSTSGWGVESGALALSTLDGRFAPITGSAAYAPLNGMGAALGLPLVASRNGANYSGVQTALSGATAKVAHKAIYACSDLRLLYGPQDGAELDLPNSVYVKAAIEVPVLMTLSSALSTGAAITSLPVTPNATPILAGTPVQVSSGVNAQTFTTTATTFAGATAITVTSATPNFAYPSGSPVSAGVIYPVTFNGKARANLDYPSGMVLSDPMSVELTAGQPFYTRSYVSAPLGFASTTTTASSTVGATTLSVTAAPAADMTYPQQITIDTGGNLETVTLNSVTGSSSPYTYNISAATKAHASGVTVYQFLPQNLQGFTDLGDRTSLNNDFAWASGFPAPPVQSTTLSANASAGDTSVKLTALIVLAETNPTITIDTGGTPETIAVTDTGAANTVYLAAPLANAHASGAICTGGTLPLPMFGPYAVVAERAVSPGKAILVVGDSIPSGNGNWSRNLYSSFVTQALDGVRPYLTGARPSEAAASYVSVVFSRRRRRLANVVRPGWAIYEYGTNDVFAGTALATIEGYATTIINSMKARGMKVAVTTLPPKTNSTDNWTTTTNQTVLQDATHETLRLNYNAWVLAGAGGLADLVIDIAAAVDSGLMTGGAATGLWGNQGGLPLSFDGIHPSKLGHTLMAAKVTAALPSMT